MTIHSIRGGHDAASGNCRGGSRRNKAPKADLRVPGADRAVSGIDWSVTEIDVGSILANYLLTRALSTWSHYLFLGATGAEEAATILKETRNAVLRNRRWVNERERILMKIKNMTCLKVLGRKIVQTKQKIICQITTSYNIWRSSSTGERMHHILTKYDAISWDRDIGSILNRKSTAKYVCFVFGNLGCLLEGILFI